MDLSLLHRRCAGESENSEYSKRQLLKFNSDINYLSQKSLTNDSEMKEKLRISTPGFVATL